MFNNSQHENGLEALDNPMPPMMLMMMMMMMRRTTTTMTMMKMMMMMMMPQGYSIWRPNGELY
eukprot:931913-Amphidinium_carterae.1